MINFVGHDMTTKSFVSKFSNSSSELTRPELILELKFIADALQYKSSDLNLSAWSTGVDENKAENTKTKTKAVFQMSSRQEKGIFWMAELSQVQD